MKEAQVLAVAKAIHAATVVVPTEKAHHVRMSAQGGYGEDPLIGLQRIKAVKDLLVKEGYWNIASCFHIARGHKPGVEAEIGEESDDECQ